MSAIASLPMELRKLQNANRVLHQFGKTIQGEELDAILDVVTAPPADSEKQLLGQMLGEMQDRGADSAGIAIYGDPTWSPAGHGCVSLLETGVDAADLDAATAAVGAELGSEVTAQLVDDTLVLAAADVDSETLLTAATAVYPTALVAGFGADLTVLKGVGAPRDLVQAWGLASASGWQGVGHTRMATESAVTPSGAHPFAVGPEQCLVHNGSFSNHATIRR